MPYRRRAILLGGLAVAGGGLIGYHELTECNEIACFSFDYHGADDVPSRLDIKHTAGEDRLRADQVYITNVSVDYESGEMDTIAWSELTDEIGPSEPIKGETIRIKLGLTDFARILWDREDYRQTIGAWVADDDTQ